ncbi:FAD/FMN-containing dehydrogenase [Sphingobium xenophagum]|uniref:FAD/FMN-containing dehydrogenase n=1 Tax=Sphingobium xenophagum TaxID=121428 RepID=A0ABU1X5H5_SPHXE|nr:FAD-binding oxidoreductase [Sphingobium xenophagum]MDR7156837.1 FAD/FMN-containing dehydrogenase [Sphingobium xenophagum]
MTSPSVARYKDFPKGITFDADPARRASFSSDRSGRLGACPIGVAKPGSVAEVQAALRWAGRRGTPVVPVSTTAGPRRRGDTVCVQEALILDLSGMNRIIHIDTQDALAIVEPGVTFNQLDDALAPHDLRAFRPLFARRSKSVIAAFLEREPMTVPGLHWDSADPLAAMECVFGTGDIFRTGGAALPGTLEQNLERGNRPLVGVGPMHTDIGRVLQGAQGALGVVSWASLYCQRRPALEVPLFATSDSFDAIAELCYKMLRRRSAGQMFILNRVQLALMQADDPSRYRDMLGSLPEWILYVELSAPAYFPEEAIAFQRADLERDAAALNVAVISDTAGITAADIAKSQRMAGDEPAPTLRGLAAEEIFYLTQLDQVQEQFRRSGVLDTGDVGIYLQPLAQGVNAHCQITLLAPAQEAANLSGQAVRTAETLAEQGAFFSRPYHPWAHVPFAQDKKIAPLLARVKALLDPGGVLQPGAQSLGVFA